MFPPLPLTARWAPPGPPSLFSLLPFLSPWTPPPGRATHPACAAPREAAAPSTLRPWPRPLASLRVNARPFLLSAPPFPLPVNGGNVDINGFGGRLFPLPSGALSPLPPYKIRPSPDLSPSPSSPSLSLAILALEFTPRRSPCTPVVEPLLAPCPFLHPWNFTGAPPVPARRTSFVVRAAPTPSSLARPFAPRCPNTSPKLRRPSSRRAQPPHRSTAQRQDFFVPSRASPHRD
jgi:hypothetical protein